MNLVEVILLTAMVTALLSYALRTLFGNEIIRPRWAAVLMALTVGILAYLTLYGKNDPYAVSTAITKGVVVFMLMRFFAKVIPVDSREKEGLLVRTNHHP